MILQGRAGLTLCGPHLGRQTPITRREAPELKAQAIQALVELAVTEGGRGRPCQGREGARVLVKGGMGDVAGGLPGGAGGHLDRSEIGEQPGIVG